MNLNDEMPQRQENTTRRGPMTRLALWWCTRGAIVISLGGWFPVFYLLEWKTFCGQRTMCLWTPREKLLVFSQRFFVLLIGRACGSCRGRRFRHFQMQMRPIPRSYSVYVSRMLPYDMLDCMWVLFICSIYEKDKKVSRYMARRTIYRNDKPNVHKCNDHVEEKLISLLTKRV